MLRLEICSSLPIPVFISFFFSCFSLLQLYFLLCFFWFQVKAKLVQAPRTLHMLFSLLGFSLPQMAPTSLYHLYQVSKMFPPQRGLSGSQWNMIPSSQLWGYSSSLLPPLGLIAIWNDLIYLLIYVVVCLPFLVSAMFRVLKAVPAGTWMSHTNSPQEWMSE